MTNKVINELIIQLKKEFDIRLCDIKGGTKDNAIPRECYFDIAIDKDASESFTLKVERMFLKTLKTNIKLKMKI